MIAILLTVTVVAAVVLVVAVLTDRMPLMYVSASITTVSGLASLVIDLL